MIDSTTAEDALLMKDDVTRQTAPFWMFVLGADESRIFDRVFVTRKDAMHPAAVLAREVAVRANEVETAARDAAIAARTAYKNCLLWIIRERGICDLGCFERGDFDLPCDECEERSGYEQCQEYMAEQLVYQDDSAYDYL